MDVDWEWILEKVKVAGARLGVILTFALIYYLEATLLDALPGKTYLAVALLLFVLFY